MSDMSRITFTADGTNAPGPLTNESLMLMVTGTIGGGTLNVQKYSTSQAAYVTVATYTAVTANAEEIKLGKGRYQFQLTGATSPSLVLDYWSV